MSYQVNTQKSNTGERYEVEGEGFKTLKEARNFARIMSQNMNGEAVRIWRVYGPICIIHSVVMAQKGGRA